MKGRNQRFLKVPLNNLDFTVDENIGLLRIDKALCSYLTDFSRNKIVSLIEAGCVSVNGVIVQKNYKTKVNDYIIVNIPEVREYEAEPEDIQLDIVYEDTDLIVVNKPKGMVVHPAHGNLSGTLVNALLYHCKGSLSGINGIMRPGIVHRIDKETSGLLVVAKNDNSHNFLAEQFKNHTCEREYRTIVYGNVKEDTGTIDKPIGRHKTERKMMSCYSEHSKRAVTHFSVIDRFKGFTYLKCKLETGRTHQIRVHMASTGHFVLGDNVYGRSVDKIRIDFEGQCLHAKTLGFIHPTTHEFMSFDSELPAYFANTLEKLINLS